MKNKILKAIEKYSLLNGGNRITVALSGGADSVALLHALTELKYELDITLSAAHFNHKIRGAEAERDEQFVRELCDKWNVPLTVGSADVPEFAKTQKISTELAARELRYEFFDGLDTDFIATAHTASDNLETLLFNIARGTSLKGLCGIPKKRDNIIRPLILCTRQDVECYCSINNLSYVTDSTNLIDDYSRNLIRHKAVPVLAEINPAVAVSVSRMTDSVAEINDFLQAQINRELEERLRENGLLIKDILKLPTALSKGVVAAFLEKYSNSDFEAVHIDLILNAFDQNKGRIDIPNGFYVKVENDYAFVKKSNCDQNLPQFSVSLTEEEFKFTENDDKIHKLFLNNTLDCDKIVGKSVLRTRGEGDFIKLRGRGCTKSLKKLFCEKKVPTEIRGVVPVLSDDLGVIWVYGLGVSERVEIGYDTTRILRIQTTVEGE